MLSAILADLRSDASPEVIAARFHNGLARVVVDVVSRIREHTGLRTVALSGGVFQNFLFLERTVEKLEERAFHTLTHLRTPPNDGALSFGQAVIAAARDHCPGGLVDSTPAKEGRT